MKHALFVAFHYPPEASSSGVLRTLKHTRYLEQFNWRVTVLTVLETAYDVVDPASISEIPETVRVVRTPFLNTRRHLAVAGSYPSLLAIPDVWVGWAPWAISQGRRILHEDAVDVVYSTSPHATAHLIARFLSRKAKLPWVADFRDPWLEDPPEAGTPPAVHWGSRILERHAVTAANRIVTSTRQLRDDLAGRYPEQPAAKFTTIFNGYDEADFANLPKSSLRNDVMTIVHAGMLHPGFRDPRPLFRALREAANEGRIDLSKVRLRFIGAGEYGAADCLARSIAENDLGSTIAFTPRMPYHAALAELAAADVLLLLQASADTAGLVPTKLYEYLRLQKPVMALVQSGASAEILAETGGGWRIDPADSAGLRDALAEAYRAWGAGGLSQRCAPLERLKRFERRALAGELAGIFNELVA